MRSSCIAVIALVLSTACAKTESGAADTGAAATSTTATSTASGAAACAGTYTQTSPSFSPKFVFNADGTGEETQAASQGGATRTFTWVRKGDNQVTITFPAEGDRQASSTDWNIDCANGTFASIYKKS
ncbi:MAG TPA: hypothetical protein VFO66_12390 [Gemmatimonadaceae bacterium]|nr:hypothetical protein [Gemmatimonadaceae bacterium]